MFHAANGVHNGPTDHMVRKDVAFKVRIDEDSSLVHPIIQGIRNFGEPKGHRGHLFRDQEASMREREL